MVIDERIGAVEDSIAAVSATVDTHDARLHVLEGQSDRVESLLVEIRDEVRAHRSRLDRLTDATTQAISVVSAAVARACDALGHRVVVLILMAISTLLGGVVGLNPAEVIRWLID